MKNLFVEKMPVKLAKKCPFIEYRPPGTDLLIAASVVDDMLYFKVDELTATELETGVRQS